MEDNKLIPTYLEADFNTSLEKLKRTLALSDTFKDYNFEGSNITMIMELMSYLSDMNSFYTNMVSKNIYADTADIYETVHRLVTQKGYIPKGYISSQATVTVTVSGDTDELFSYGDQLYISEWQSINTGLKKEDSTEIFYNLTIPLTTNVSTSGNTFTFDIEMREGTMETLRYRGEDMIDNNIILPFKEYDHGSYPFEVPSIRFISNDIQWTRIDEFYDNMSGLNVDDNIFVLSYDKYNRYNIGFSNSRNTPDANEVISVDVLVSNGSDGIIGPLSINIDNSDLTGFLIYNSTKNIYIPVDNITQFTNLESSVGGSIPETVSQLKSNSSGSSHSQFRNITKTDYKSHLEMRSDVVRGFAWGEQESNPGNTNEYNKIYISVIPQMGNDTYFTSDVITTSPVNWVDTNTPSISGSIDIPDLYTTSFINDLLVYLEERKMMNVYETLVLPELIYFRFDIGIRVKRTYNYVNVMTAVKNKLTYFFDSNNRSFNEEINFMDIKNFIMDRSISSSTDNFSNIAGVDYLTIRDIVTYTPSLSGSGEEYIYEPNTNLDYPQYTIDSYDTHVGNILRPIKVGFSQFPCLAIDMCVFTQET